MVSGTLGLSLSGPVQSTNGADTLCTYNPTGPSETDQVGTSVEFQAGVTPAAFAAEQVQASKNNQITAVPGLGSGAFTFSVQTATSSFTVLYFLSDGIQTGISSPATLSAEESLAGQILPSL